jgi:hypothetical protein
MIRIGNFLENFNDLFYDKNKNLERNKISLQTLKVNLKFEILEIEGIFQRFFRSFCINFPASSQFFLEIILKREIKESERGKLSSPIFPRIIMQKRAFPISMKMTWYEDGSHFRHKFFIILIFSRQQFYI